MASVPVSISTTSLSGMVYLMTLVHAMSAASTIRPTCGGVGRLLLMAGTPFVGCGGALSGGTSVVRLPDSANAAYILVPLEFTVSARGFSPNRGMFVITARVLASNTMI